MLWPERTARHLVVVAAVRQYMIMEVVQAAEVRKVARAVQARL
jgi:hypothetical protein